MPGLIQDLAYALRMLRKTPALTAIAVLVLAFGIGANTAIFSVVNAVLLQPLPFPHSDRIVQVCRENNYGEQIWISVPNYLDWQKQSGAAFAALAAYNESNFNLAGNGAVPQRAAGDYVATTFLAALGIHPALGSNFQPSDDQPGRPPVALLSYRLWQSRFGGDPGIIGRVVRINDQPVPILGVLPADFRFVGDPDILEPLQPEALPQDRDAQILHAIGRLRPGVSFAMAQAEMHAIGQRLARQYPKADGGDSVGLVPLQQQWSGNLRPALLILFGAVGLVLLIACADLANLLLAKAASRQKEIAIRLAMGAGRARILRQLLTESIVLALAGAALGLALAAAAVRAIVAWAPAAAAFSNSTTLSARLDAPVLMFTLALAVVTGVLFGLAPALRISRTDLNLVLQQEAGRGGASRTGRPTLRNSRGLLIVAEIALTLPLLLGAALLLSSYRQLHATDGGFQPGHLLTAHLALAPQRYAGAADIAQLTNILLPRLRAIPGVRAAAVTLVLPLGLCPDFPMEIGGRAPDPNNPPDAQWHPSTSQTFAALGIPILRGRGILDSDTKSSAPIVVLNQRSAETWWPRQNPIGQTIWIAKNMGPAFADPAPRTVVGVVGDVRQDGLNRPAPQAIYIPLAQIQDGAAKLLVHLMPLALALRTAGPPAAARVGLQNAVWSVDPQQPISDLEPMAQVEAAALAPQQFNLVLLGVFALLALLLAVIGVYGVMSYAIAQRTREIGLRLAVGASPSKIMAMVFIEGLRLTAVGIAIGIALALALTRVLASLLYGMQTRNPATFALTALALAAVAAAACWLPARRAAHLDPMVALRQD